MNATMKRYGALRFVIVLLVVPGLGALLALTLPGPGGTCDFGQASFYSAQCVHDNGNAGQLGTSFYGANGQHNNGNFGSLGSSESGAYGIHLLSANYGYLGGSSYGAYGQYSSGPFGYLGSSAYGAYGRHTNGNVGFLGGSTTGAYGQHNSGNVGLLGHANYGVYGTAPANDYAGYFSGRAHITGTLSKGGGSFKIDHPLDPEGQYLSHSFVESPDMINVYNGTVVTDAQGEALVELPAYFEALNREFRYQLTAIGAPGPTLYIAEEIAGNRFRIAGGQPGMKVSWQVTGVRQDPWAEAHRIVVEEAKPAQERGFYLHPRLYGQPAERSVEWGRDPEGMRAMQEMPARWEEERRKIEAEQAQHNAGLNRLRPGSN